MIDKIRKELEHLEYFLRDRDVVSTSVNIEVSTRIDEINAILDAYEKVGIQLAGEECDTCNHFYVNVECRNCNHAENIPAVTNNLYCKKYCMLVNRKMSCAEFVHLTRNMKVTIGDIPSGEEEDRR